MSKKDAKNLTPKQEKFVEEYLVDLNATQAALRAGYSENTAYSIGFENLKKPEIQAAIQSARNKLSKRTGITVEMVVAELARIGFSNIGHYLSFNESGVNMHSSDMMNEDALRCISEVSQTVTAEGGTVKFKLHDKQAALDKLMRHLGGYDYQPDDEQKPTPVKVEISVKDARKPSDAHAE